MSDIDPIVFRAALAKLRVGFGVVFHSEYLDIQNRTGPYRKGGPLDLGDAWYVIAAKLSDPRTPAAIEKIEAHDGNGNGNGTHE